MPMTADRTCLITEVIVLNHQIPPSIRGGVEAMPMTADRTCLINGVIVLNHQTPLHQGG